MVISLILVGKTSEKYLEQGIAEYVKRLVHYNRFSMEVIPELKNAKNMRQEQIKEAEGELILSKLSTADRVVLLDEGGKQPSSVEMADWLQTIINRGTRRLVFVVEIGRAHV